MRVDGIRSEDVRKLADAAFKKIQKGVSPEQAAKLSRLWDYLSEEDLLMKADLVYVFAGPGINRAAEAAALYREGMAPKILFCGKKAIYMDDPSLTEAETYAKLALWKEVPPEDLILETEATSTPANVARSVRLLKSMDFLPQTIILITVPYHMRRCYLTLKAGADWNPTLIRHCSKFSDRTRDDYFLSRDEWTYVCFEFIKLYSARLMRHL